jgi:hypothetical protein
MAIVVFVVVAGALLGIGRPPSEQRVAGITDAPTNRTAVETAVIVTPGSSIAGTSAEPGATDPAGATTVPGATAPVGPGGPGGGPTEQPDPTPRPTRPQATPTPEPPPTPTLVPTPLSTPTPEPQCTVPNLIGQITTQASATWSAAGFTGPITDDPPMQPNQRIGWQSLTAGTSEPCASGITVRKVT